MSFPVNSTATGRAPSCERPWTAAPTLWLAGLYAALLALTRPTYIGDTYWYARDIDRALERGAAGSIEIWNFAHLLLRPLGILLSRIFLNTAAPYFAGDRQMAITFLLIAGSVVAAFVCAVFVQKMTWALTRSNVAAFAAATGFLSVSVVLNYSRSGASYLPGLACSLASLYLAGFSSARPSRAAPVWSGILAAFAALFWLPYVVSFPAILLAGPILRRGGRREDVSWSLLFLVAAGLTLLVAYGAAAAAIHVTNWNGLADWVRSSDTQLRDRKLLRMLTGWARSFYELGNDAVYLKWYLFKDPYANIGLAELLRVSFLKLGLFYISMGGLAILLWISRTGRPLLLLVCAAMLPQIGMALMFESGSPERYLAGLPLIFVGFGYAIANASFGVRTRVVAAVLCCAHIPVNLAALSAPAVNASIEGDAGRVAALASLGPSNRLYVLNGFDGLFVLRSGHPFHPLNRKAFPEVTSIVPLGPRVPFWRSDFACTALSTWEQGGEVWITRRMLSTRPDRSWLWVEGDDRRLSWNALHGFFSAIERGPERGGPDGFFLVPQDAAARTTMLANVPGGDPRNCPPPGGTP